MLGYFLAVAYMPLAELTALAFTKPLFATIGAASSCTRSCAAGAGARSRSASWAYDRAAARRRGLLALRRLVLLSALASAVVVLMVKQMTARDGSTTIVLTSRSS